MESLRFQKIGDVPQPSDDYALVANSVANDGALLFLSIEPTGISAVAETETRGIGTFPKARMKDAKRFRLAISRPGEVLRTIALPPLDVTFPRVDIFPNGTVLIVAPRCKWRGPGDCDLNGVIFDPETAQVSRILLGDGISSVYVDALGRIWVAYFDEGVFGNFGWGNPGPTPIGAGGLVCFSERGQKIWEYPGDHGMADCYALNVSGSEAAMFFYTDFPLCRISSDFKLAYWKTGLRGCHQFAISERKVLFSGQYGDPSDVAYLGNLEAREVLRTRRVQLLLPDGSAVPEGQLLGRGRHLYFFDARSVYCASVD